MERLLQFGAFIALVVAVSCGADEATAEPTAGPKIYTAAQIDHLVGAGVSISISIMLIGSISFMMGLFYLVNSEDEDIRLYAWKVVSATISIFCAVLLFQAFNGLVEEYLIDGGYHMFGVEEESAVGKMWECFIDIVQLLFWLTAMQAVLAITSGAVSEMSDWLWQPEDMEQIEIATKSWAVLCAHITGFAAINAWGSVQQNMLGYSPFTAVIILPIGLCAMQMCNFCFNYIREAISLGDDGEIDEKEATWDAETEESENDVAGLSMSFLTAQALRFWIGGHLPNEEGKEDHIYGFHHSPWDCKLLLMTGFVFMAGLMISIQVRGRYPEEPEEIKKERTMTKKEEEEAEEAFKRDEAIIRPLLIAQVYFSCGMAWSFFYGTYWTIASAGWTDQDAMLQVIIAIVISAVSFAVIAMFDKIDDSGILGSEADKAILAIIDALGILIGFSWEQSFDVAVDVISEDVDRYVPKTFARLIMSFALCVVVFPAWKAYILPRELDLKNEATGLGQKRKKFKDKLDKHQHHFLEGELSERELDHAHLVMKLHRRQNKGSRVKPVKDEEGEKPLKHMLMTAKGLINVPPSDDALLEKLLPEHMREPEEEEEESRWSAGLKKLTMMLRLSKAEDEEESKDKEAKEKGDEA